MQRKVVIGNWKMNPLAGKEAEKLFLGVSKNISDVRKTDIIICPPFLYLERLKRIKTSKVKLGAQDAFFADSGPFTGEVSPDMLASSGVHYVILGHSKRREFGETNGEVSQKVRASLQAGLIPIVCVGENLRDENHDYFKFVGNQVSESLDGVSKESLSKVIIAYEPVWAISSTKDRADATPHDAEEMSLFIRKTLVDKFGLKIKMPRIIYGGDVSKKNAGEFLRDGGVEGLLVGRASLDSEKFVEIIKICEALEK